jgi:hypothetical protein
MNLIDHALRYAAAGFEVFPVSPADKAPLTTNGMKDATCDPAQVAAWWTATPTALIGCRIPVDMMALDIDPRHGGLDTWRLLIDSYGPIPGGRRHRSGRGDDGFHQWFFRPAGKLSAKELHEWARRSGVGQQAGKRSWTSGIDILHHDHRYTILPPSPHPETGLPYEWLTKGDPAPLPAWLEQYVIARPPASATPPAARPVLRLADDSSIADWFSRSANWNDLLGPAGWLRVEGDGDGDGSKWRHPNASAKQSSSIRHGCLFVYSPNTDFEMTEDGDANGYTRFRAWAILDHGGDMAVAARAAREMRDGPSTFDVFGGITGPTMSPPATTATATDTGDDWPAPIPVGVASEVPPAFPIDVFPAWIADHVAQVAKELQVPVDLPAALAIVGLAVCCAKRAEVWVTRTWREPLCLYVVVAMPPGAGKSPAVRFMLGSLEAHERQLRDAAIPAIAEAETRRAILEKSQRKAIDKGETAMALALGDDMLALRVPVEPRLFVDDVTVEKLSDLLGEQNGRLALVSTEGGLFDQMAGRYSERGSKANLDPYLQMWSGDTVRVDRVGRGSVVIDRPALTIGLTVQPTVLSALAERPELKGRGLTARFMYALPPSNVGYRNMLTGEADIDDIVADRYDQRMLALWRQLEVHGTAPARLDIAPEARQRFTGWRQALEEARRPGADLAALAEWSTKVESSVARLAGLLHLAHGNDAGQPVSDATMAAAITVGEYWIAHAKAVHALWETDQEMAAAGTVLAWLADQGSVDVSVRDIYAAHRTLFPRATDVAAPLALLVERGWLRPLFEGPLVVGKRGVPSPRFAVHPRLSSYVRHNHARMRELRVETSKKAFSLSLGENTDKADLAHDAHARMTPESTSTPTTDHGGPAVMHF